MGDAVRKVDLDSPRRAWVRISPESKAPTRTDLLKPRSLYKRSKSYVFRMHGVGPEGLPIIAKLCKTEVAQFEQEIYRNVLGVLSVDSLHCYGSVAEPDSDLVWLFVEDAGEDAPAGPNEVNRVAASEWLGKFHAAGSDLGHLRFLPRRDSDYFLGQFQQAHDSIRRGLAAKLWEAESREVLRAVERNLTLIAKEWEGIEQSWASIPHSVVHGDFLVRHNKQFDGHSGTRMGVWDWEMAGWGPIALDLATIRAHQTDRGMDAYLEGASTVWPHLTAPRLARIGELGFLLRRISAVFWATASLASRHPEWAIADIILYDKNLAEALDRRVWRLN